MYTDEELDYVQAKNHTRRLAKVTLYLDVPSEYREGTLGPYFGGNTRAPHTMKIEYNGHEI